MNEVAEKQGVLIELMGLYGREWTGGVREFYQLQKDMNPAFDKCLNDRLLNVVSHDVNTRTYVTIRITKAGIRYLERNPNKTKEQ